MSGIAETDVPQGPEGTLAEEKVQNSPPVLNTLQTMPGRFCPCNREAKNTQIQYLGLGRPSMLQVNNLLFSFLGSKETNFETPVISTQDNSQ